MEEVKMTSMPEAPRDRMRERIQALGLGKDVDEEHLTRWWVAMCTWLILLRKNLDFFATSLPVELIRHGDGTHYDLEILIMKIRSFKDKLLWLLHAHYQIDLQRSKRGQLLTSPDNLSQSGLIPPSICEAISPKGILGVDNE